MYLVDTSVWIDYINGIQSAHVDTLDEILKNPLAAGINKLIYLEILQGAKNQQIFNKFNRYLCGQRFYSFKPGLDSYRLAANIFINSRQQGITIRSTIDCLIAQCAIENELILFHHDRDYIRLAEVTGLKQMHFLKAS